MKPTWILVANASRARCFARDDDDAPLMLMKSFVHPQSRARDTDLTVAGLGHGKGAATYVPRLDPKDKEHDQFAEELADHLNAGIAAHQFGALVLIASNPFLGEIKNRLSEQAAKSLRAGVAADFTSFEGRELQQRVDTALSAR
jgi:protein required for attachment to host cells